MTIVTPLPPPAIPYANASEADGPPSDQTYETRLGEVLKEKFAVVYVGYSGAGYAAQTGIKEAIARDLKAICEERGRKDDVVVVAGGTPEGIGVVYEVARDMRLATLGIVAEQGAQYASANCETLVTVTNGDTNDWSTRMPQSGEELVVTALRIANEQGKGAQLLAYNGGPQAFVEAMAAAKAGYNVKIAHEHQAMKTDRPMPFNDPDKFSALIAAGATLASPSES